MSLTQKSLRVDPYKITIYHSMHMWNFKIHNFIDGENEMLLLK